MIFMNFIQFCLNCVFLYTLLQSQLEVVEASPLSLKVGENINNDDDCTEAFIQPIAYREVSSGDINNAADNSKNNKWEQNPSHEFVNNLMESPSSSAQVESNPTSNNNNDDKEEFVNNPTSEARGGHGSGGHGGGGHSGGHHSSDGGSSGSHSHMGSSPHGYSSSTSIYNNHSSNYKLYLINIIMIYLALCN